MWISEVAGSTKCSGQGIGDTREANREEKAAWDSRVVRRWRGVGLSGKVTGGWVGLEDAGVGRVAGGILTERG